MKRNPTRKPRKAKEEEQVLLNRSEIAQAMKVNLTTVDNWRRRGMPEVEHDGKTLFPYFACYVWATAFRHVSESRSLGAKVEMPLAHHAGEISTSIAPLIFKLWLSQDPDLSAVVAKLTDALGSLEDLAGVTGAPRSNILPGARPLISAEPAANNKAPSRRRAKAVTS